jgi:hypothetical protein
MTNRFMMSVAAAALIAGTGFAYAQGTGTGSSGPSSGGSTVQQSAPSGGSATSPSGSTTSRDATDSKPSDSKPSSGMKATQSDQKSPGASQNQRADDKMGQKSKNMSADDKSGGGKDMKGEGQKDRMNAEGQKDRGNMNAEGQKDRNGTTTGQVGGSAKLSTEQRTKITTVIRSQHVQPLTNVNFEIRAGARVPRDVRFNPLPQEIVTIYPQWRGYEYVLVGSQILVINPRTLEIVDIIEA